MILETERLILRPFLPEDAENMYALNEDPEVLQYTGDVQFVDVEATRVFLTNYDQYEKYAVGRLLVIRKEDQEILGWCGLKYHPEEDEYDIGYRFFKKHWGKGYATESAIASMDYGQNTLGIKRIVGRARIENSASIGVFSKLNMHYVEDFEEDGQHWVLYALEKSS
ncbi:GNAT family N-acetyltransferase [Sphingobacterium psychroaquaticum]|uniref:Protein N-acetyltransferase, RimJ/RimL family n=1 Tax=Sphingobacterium psychroaquaticum TaxID=561061 RepID=A0A1X7JMW9_9SPHI|nr:GNAT family N-acetyltransferase [Sphingobacterium psychroaquaticum]SMG28773.1 Protein N-acetyltransferase, RimJ/RimL family [Sphingobacterium psychroaquaticum]